MLSMLPSPYGMLYRVFGVVSGRTAPEPHLAEDATAIEVAILSRRPGRSRHDRGALEHRDLVVTAWATAIVLRQSSLLLLLVVPVAPVLVSLVRSYTSLSPGARYLRACTVREVVTIAWDLRPRELVEGVLQATSVLELAAE
ncbi:hypothetical protein Taro_054620 [Colocasia esculenta]|uniref:Uncharacterized protein n=1 Tax=Colocasia esculenta TaxID=4460 RepID=A0A843XRS1_COLES|nr:hypothetical protein [Colocasia esculenta]